MELKEALKSLQEAVNYLRTVKDISKIYFFVPQLYRLFDILPLPQKEQAREVAIPLMGISDIKDVANILDIFEDDIF